MDTFGKEPEQLANIAEVFKLVLGRFTIQQVEMAFRIYMEKETTMPKPADIVKIIEPPVEPRKWCKVTFLDIKRKKRENVFTSLAEDQYCEDFIRAATSTTGDERALLEAGLRQESLEHKQYWIGN